MKSATKYSLDAKAVTGFRNFKETVYNRLLTYTDKLKQKTTTEMPQNYVFKYVCIEVCMYLCKYMSGDTVE